MYLIESAAGGSRLTPPSPAEHGKCCGQPRRITVISPCWWGGSEKAIPDLAICAAARERRQELTKDQLYLTK